MKEYHLTYNEFRDKQVNEKLNGKYIVENWGTFYYKDGKTHRADGPADEFHNGTKYWCVDDVWHRLDGPAIEYAHGDVRYHINGKEYSSKEEFEIAAYLYKNELENYK